MTFVDASAALAILLREDDWRPFVDALEQGATPIISAIAMWEIAAGLARQRQITIVEARAETAAFLDAAEIRIVPIGEAEFAVALDAFDRFGKGRHPAALNMGDCFAYACARTNGAALLFKGDDFAATDIAR